MTTPATTPEGTGVITQPGLESSATGCGANMSCNPALEQPEMGDNAYTRRNEHGPKSGRKTEQEKFDGDRNKQKRQDYKKIPPKSSKQKRKELKEKRQQKNQSSAANNNSQDSEPN